MTGPRRVAVTGIGCVSALGLDAASTWAGAREGRSAIRPPTLVDTGHLGSKVAAEVPGFEAERYFARRDLPMLDRFCQIGLVAADEALADSGLAIDGGLAHRSAVVMGAGVGGLSTLDESYLRVYGERIMRIHPFTIPKTMANAAASQISMRHGIRGPAFAVASACSSSNHAIGLAMGLVRLGQADVALAGGSESMMCFGGLKSWEALRVASSDTCRPFCADRSGMVVGEGGAVVVLEEMERARARGAEIHAELAGFGMTSDAGDLVAPSADGAADAIAAALEDAGLAPDRIGYVNAHGTGTPANDPTETRAIRRAFGPAADGLAVSSTKSMHGHAIGAAGAIELAITLMAMRDGIVPPTANFTRADPLCDLDYVPNEARDLRFDAAVSNSFAFGGLNAVLAVKRV